MKSIRQKNNMIKRARAGVKGLVISWHDKDPLRDTQAHIRGTVTHKSPLFHLCAQKVFSDFKDWIVHHQPFHWLITITVVFVYDNGTRQNEIRELEAFATLDRINEHSLDAIRDALRHGNANNYTHTEFRVECVDTNDRRKPTGEAA